MLVLTSSIPSGRLGTLLSALIVVSCAVGLTMHSDFYAGIRRKDFYVYYTNLSNLLVLIYFAAVAPRLYAKAALRPLIPHAEYAVMMSIMLTYFVFHHLLMPAIFGELRRARRTREWTIMVLSNLVVHYVVPWLVFFYWLLCSPDKKALCAWDALLWTCIPLLYLFFVLLRAPIRGVIAGTASAYPYPFLDIQRRGGARVMRSCLLLYGGCLLVGFCIIVSTRLMLSLWGDGHAWILI